MLKKRYVIITSLAVGIAIGTLPGMENLSTAFASPQNESKVERRAERLEQRNRTERPGRIRERVKTVRDSLLADTLHYRRPAQTAEQTVRPVTNTSPVQSRVARTQEQMPKRPVAAPVPVESTSKSKTVTTKAPASKPSEVETVEADETEKVLPPPDSSELSIALANRIHVLTNEKRREAGVPALSADAKLASVAQAHSVDMAGRGFFSHQNPDGCSPSCRLKKAGYDYAVMGENIAWISGAPLDADTLAKKFVMNWMSSEGHRKNMLSPDFTHEGVGVYVKGGKVYASANFSKPQ
jgi:uncharacterized protein YkwD